MKSAFGLWVFRCEKVGARPSRPLRIFFYDMHEAKR